MAGKLLVALDTLALRATACALSVTCGDSSPKGRAKSTAGSFLIMPNTLVMNFTAWLSLRGKTSPVPGEDVTAGDKRGNLARERLRGFSPLKVSRKPFRSAALSQKAALQLPFSVMTPPVKMEHRSVRRRSGVPKFKIIFPLNMPSNDDDRRQWRKQGGVVGAAASKTRVPPKARCGCWVPQPVSQRSAFKIVPRKKQPPHFLVQRLLCLCQVISPSGKPAGACPP